MRAHREPAPASTSTSSRPGSGAGGTFAAGAVAVVGTNAQGVATAPAFTANDTAGSYSVDAQSDYGTVNLYLTNTASGLAASITATGGTSQESPVNLQYAAPLQARVLDANGRPVQGATVSFAVVNGTTGAGASFLGGGPATATTDSNGLATSPALLANGVPGRFSATASIAGVAAVATYALDNHAVSTAIAAVASSAAATVEKRYPQPLRARVLDGSGNPVEGASVTFAIAPAASGAGAAFLGGGAQANVLTDVNGEATSPPLVADKTAGTFTATATTAGGSRPLGYALKNRAGAPDAIAVGAASGESTTAGSRFPIRLAVTVTDKDGNAVSGAGVTFSAPARGPSGRFAHGRTVRVATNADGVAIAPPFTANAKAGGYAVTAAVRRHLETGGVRARQRAARMSSNPSIESPRLRFSDLARVASVGLRTRRVRAGLSALGIAIGVAAIVAVLGLSSSSQAGLLAEIDKLGTNLLTVSNGQSLFGRTAELPLAAPGMIARIGPVTQVQETGSTSANVYRTPLIPSVNTNALSVQAASLRTARHRRHHRRGRELPERGHRARAGGGARCGRRAAARHRPRLPRRAGLARRAVVLPRRHPHARPARPGDRQLRARRLPGGRTVSRLRRASDHRLRPQRDEPGRRRAGRARRDRESGGARTRSTSASPRRRSPRAPRRRARSTASSSGSAPSRFSWERSASGTSC